MIVRDVGRELAQRKAATLSQLTAELGAERALVESALTFWVHRGSVRVCGATATVCGTGCRRCPIGASGPPATAPTEAAVYEWVQPETQSP
jgi:hypothetical protein